MIARLLISRGLQLRINEITKTLAKNGLSTSHPDLLYLSFDSKLGIEQARKIKDHFSVKPYQAKGKAAVLEDASSLTVDAQNALLKLLEEPPENAILLLGAPSEDKFLPTVLSRCQVVILSEAKDINSYSSPSVQSDKFNIDIPKLLESSIESRFEYIEKCKSREELLHTLVDYFRQQLQAPGRDPFGSEPQGRRPARLEVVFLKELLQAEEWAAQNVNIRAILEYLMLIMPKRP